MWSWRRTPIPLKLYAQVACPSEFDLLQARLFGSVNHADSNYFAIAIPLVIVAALLILGHSKKLNVLSLGQSVATTLGVKHQVSTIYTLVLVSVLMSVSTALVGPLTFYGFLVATLSYQAARTYDHRYIFPMALAIGFLIITGAYFIMYHIFDAQGVVSVIIELFGGITFLSVILKGNFMIELKNVRKSYTKEVEIGELNLDIPKLDSPH